MHDLSTIYEQKYCIEAYAKLNLRLKVTGRKSDGYHLLSMLNVLVDLKDELVITFHKDPSIEISVYGNEEISLKDPNKNLASRAARLFLEEFDIDVGLSIQMNKNIPLGSGLGGGSSDAAAVLSVCAKVFEAFIGDELEHKLNKIALELGADVPYFLNGSLAKVSGIGENLKLLPGTFINQQACLVIYPSLAISTKEIYDLYRETHPVLDASPDRTLEDFSKKLEEDSSDFELCYGKLLNVVENDFQLLAAKLHPEINNLIKALQSIPDICFSMTGSGSAFFVFPKQYQGDIGDLRPIICERAGLHPKQIYLTRILA